MPGFSKGPDYRDPFGNHNFLRSTRGVKTLSATFAAETLPTELIDGKPQRVLRKGETIVQITSGPWAGKVGVLQAAGSAGTPEVQTLTEGTNVTAGSFKVTALGDQTGALAWDITAAQLQTALNALAAVAAFGSVTVTGGPVTTTPFTVTFSDEDGIGQNVAAMTVDATALTGTIVVATATPGVDGPTDGRAVRANILGLNGTYLPWQLIERDVEITVYYECAAVQGKCYERDAAGARIALSDTTAAEMFGKKNLDIRFPE